jgi:uncharacterized membrane protein
LAIGRRPRREPIATRIRAWESQQKHPTGIRWQGIVALILGAILLASGVVLFVSAHWDEFGPGARLTIVLAMVALFHLAGAYTRASFRSLSTALHAVGTASTGAAIALVGQIFNIQEHWPAAILLWALAALAGWALLHDEAQQTLTLLLIPAWLLSELAYYSQSHIGQSVYHRPLPLRVVRSLSHVLSRHEAQSSAGNSLRCRGRRSHSRRRLHAGKLGLVGRTNVPPAPCQILELGRDCRSAPVCRALPLRQKLHPCWRRRPGCRCFAVVQPHIGGALQLSAARTQIPTRRASQLSLAHALVAAFAIFLIWWGVRQASKALVNLGIVGFAITVVWFYFSNILDKFGRSLGLIGLGILFLAGGWALERMRRRLIAQMSPSTAATEVVQ